MRNMLPKHRRLRKKEFSSVYETGRNINSETGYFKVKKTNDSTRIACAVSKKETKNSVDRTRIRRRGYAAIETLISDIPDGFDIIWFLPPNALTAEFGILTNCVEGLISSLQEI